MAVELLERPSGIVVPQMQTYSGERVVRPWRETRLLAPGSRSGIGLAMVTDLIGTTDIPEIHMGTRSMEKFDQSIQAIEKVVPGFDHDRIKPFIADLGNRGEAVAAYQQIEGRVTDIWDFSAAGVEWLMDRDRILKPLMQLGRLNKPDSPLKADNEQLVALQTFIDSQVAISMPYAQAVNYEGPIELFDYAKDKLPKDAFLGFESSLWSTFRVNVPRFYRATAETKGMFEDYMEAQAAAFQELKLHPAIVSGHLTLDTVVGKIIERYIFAMLEDPSRKEAAVGYGIPEIAMAQVTRQALESDPKTWNADLRRWFVYGESGGTKVTTELSGDHEMFKDRLLV